MRRFAFLLPLVGFVACGDPSYPPQEEPPPDVTLATQDVGQTLSGVACADTNDPNGPNSAIDGPHFDTIAISFGDSTEDPNQCGDLDFDGRDRIVSASLATTDPAESPYKYWWRRGRSAETGATQGLTQVRVDTTPAGVVVSTGAMPMPLSLQYDAVGLVLIITNDGTLPVTDSAFLYESFDYAPGIGINYRLQHWGELLSPVLNSAVVNGTTITLTWENRHPGRPIDRTMVFRNGAHRTTLGHNATSWPDTGVGPGQYTYRLKHVSTPVMVHGALARPNSATSDSIRVTVGTACARLVEAQGSASTWKVADQYLSAGCSLEQGAHMRYRWLGAGEVVLQDWTADTLFDFLGHTGTGTQRVILEDSNTVSDTTSRDTLAFTVFNNQVVLSGPTYIRDKGTKTYAATAGGSAHAGQWFERYDDGPGWYPATAGDQTSMNRIWPAGEYTVDLRQHKLDTNTVLHRGRRLITVCTGCPPLGPEAGASAALTDDPWSLFGLGPWVSWGTGASLRWYDLWGMPDRASPFTEVSWFTGAGGEVADLRTGWSVTWAPRELGLADARLVDVAVEGAAAGSYVFSMAVDPDLGLDAADDVASYDATRHLVLVADADRALGLLLRQAGRNALAGVQEYGVRRWAPRTSAEAWVAQRVAGVSLVGTPRDVQLLLSADVTTGPGSWEVVVVRGATVGDVQAVADAVLGRLR